MTRSPGFRARTACIRQPSQARLSPRHVWCESCCRSPSSEPLEPGGRPRAPCVSAACALTFRSPERLTSVLQYLGRVSKGSNFPSASGPGHSQVGMEYTKGTALSGLRGGPSVSRIPAPRARYCWGHGPGKATAGQMRVMLSLSVIPLQHRACAMGLCWRK